MIPLAETINRMFVDAGFSIERIARKLGVDRAIVCRSLGAEYLLHNLPARESPWGTHRRRRFTMKERTAIVQCYRAGSTAQAVADRFECSVGHVRKLAARA